MVMKGSQHTAGFEKRNEKKYIAFNSMYDSAVLGTLEEIMEGIDDNSHDFEDYEFFEATPIMVKLEKKIMLVAV